MKKKTLYDHQQDAVDSAIDAVMEGQKSFYLNCCVSFGKSLVIAHMCNMTLKKGNRALVLTPSKELCEQNYLESIAYMDNANDIGIVCASLNKKQQSRKCVIATYQTFLSLRAASGKFSVVFVDEAHLVSNNEETSIRRIIKSLQRINPNLLVIGFTGSPFRMNGQGELTNDNQDGKAFFESCVYESDVSEMIRLGYLSNIKSISGDVQIDLSGKEFNNGISTDYNTKLVGVKFDEIVEHCVKDMKVKFLERNVKTAAMFTSTIENAEHVISEWDNDDEIKILHGGMGKKERERTLKWIESGIGNRYIVNVGILTTGWNMPTLDCVAMLRATKSISLYVQCCGRVIRAHTCDKGIEKIGMIYDVGGNIERFGALNSLNMPKNTKRRGEAPKKLCDITLDRDLIDSDGYLHKAGTNCNTQNILSAKKCKLCGAHFMNDSTEGGYSMRSQAQILSGKEDAKIVEYEVGDVVFEVAVSQKTGINMIKMKLFDIDNSLIHDHYLCLNHQGKAQTIAKSFLRKMFKNQSDFYQLGAVGVNVNNIFPLVSNKANYENFFKKIVSVKIAPQRDNPRHNEIRNLIFEV